MFIKLESPPPPPALQPVAAVRRFICAIVTNAFDALFDPAQFVLPDDDDGEGRLYEAQTVTASLQYFRSDDSEYLLSFISICRELDLNPRGLRIRAEWIARERAAWIRTNRRAVANSDYIRRWRQTVAYTHKGGRRCPVYLPWLRPKFTDAERRGAVDRLASRN